MKDLFSKQSRQYARYRPGYPDELFDFILSHVKEREAAWDCGTGNGQVAIRLSEHFETVYATDISENQLAHTLPKDNIIYRKMPAEKATFPGQRFDLITVAQAIHWFDMEQFYERAQAHLKPEGIIAAFGYGVVHITPEIDKVIDRLYAGILGDYWDQERSYVDAHYRTILFPFEEISAPPFAFKTRWPPERLIGYLNTWSAVQHYQKENKRNPVGIIKKGLRKAWGAAKTKRVTFPVFVRMGLVDLL